MVLAFYTSLTEALRREGRAVLMVVTESTGSSPGRRGFKMWVSPTGMNGTIGGGIMEHKWVEYARSLLSGPAFAPFSKLQIHDKSPGTDRSGLICSGRQTIAFYDVGADRITLLESAGQPPGLSLTYTEAGIFAEAPFASGAGWQYTDAPAPAHRVYIIGGGHVSRALCGVLSRLDFEIHVFDNREQLNTLMHNPFAHSRTVVEYERLADHIPSGPHSFVVIMSFGYRSDEAALRALLHLDFGYIGMMGSKAKVKAMFDQLLAEGIAPERLQRIFAPIGLDIKSETAEEIAVSVAAQLIAAKNRPVFER